MLKKSELNNLDKEAGTCSVNKCEQTSVSSMGESFQD